MQVVSVEYFEGVLPGEGTTAVTAEGLGQGLLPLASNLRQMNFMPQILHLHNRNNSYVFSLYFEDEMTSA